MALSLPMCAVGARSQANAGRADSISNIEADTAAVVADTTAALLPVAGQPFENDPRVVEIDDESYILSNGGAYRLTDVSDALAFNPIYDPDDFNEFYESGSRKQMLPVIAICFIVPCLTLIIGLVLLLAFFMKKTVARNSIIEKAIDAGYQLPDSFYSTTSAYTHVAGSTNADTIDGQSAPAPQPVSRWICTVPVLRRQQPLGSGLSGRWHSIPAWRRKAHRLPLYPGLHRIRQRS